MSSLSGYRPDRIKSCLERKLGIDFQGVHELNGWYILDGRKELHITVPKGHGARRGGGELSKGTMKRIINSLRISNIDFADLYGCPMSGTDYERVIRTKLHSNSM